MEIPEVEIEALCAYVEMDLENGIQMNVSDWRQLLAKVRSWLEAVEHRVQADASLGYVIPEGYDAICNFCHYPFIFKHAKGFGTKEWKKYCCSSCENGTTEKRSRR